MSDPTTNMEDDVIGTVSALKSYSSKLTGWAYDDRDSIESNIIALVDGLIVQAHSSTKRVENLQAMLGKMMERMEQGPQP